MQGQNCGFCKLCEPYPVIKDIAGIDADRVRNEKMKAEEETILMNGMIRFPNLGIELENVGKTISLFGFEIAYYGIIIGLAMLVGIFLAERDGKATGQNPENYTDYAIYCIIFSIIGARLYYVMFAWENYKDNLLSIFNLREGGLAIYGGVIAAVITLFVFARIRKLSFWQMADSGCIGLVAGQIIGRWGNFFNREAFGGYTENFFAMQIPLTDVRNSDLTAEILENIKNIGGIEFIQVHPTFLYESLWNLGVLIFILWYRRKKKFHGEVFLIYLLGYGIGRAWIEGLRTDQLLIPVLGLPVSQVLAGVLVVVAAVLIAVNRKRAKTSENS
nr:prolipoprotein diacylglyceryl transferase [Anaerobium acetethylicum]